VAVNSRHRAYDIAMAVIHISEAEALRDLSRLMAKVHAGVEVRIEGDAGVVAMVPVSEKRKTLSEAIRLAEERNDNVTLDDQFSHDLEIVICNHEHEGLRNPWEE
jgi:antitoxin (DNA-binding transcriptional repressor) of toxin-antitoxin stability system